MVCDRQFVTMGGKKCVNRIMVKSGRDLISGNNRIGQEFSFPEDLFFLKNKLIGEVHKWWISCTEFLKVLR